MDCFTGFKTVLKKLVYGLILFLICCTSKGSSLLNTRVEYVNDFTSRLIIEGYTDEANGGIYVCGVYSFAKSTLLGDLNPKQIGESMYFCFENKFACPKLFF